MASYETYVEALLLYASEQDIDEIRTLLQNKFSKLEPTLRLQSVTTGTPHGDDMELKDYCLEPYGQIAEPDGYQLKQFNFFFIADREQDKEALGMQIYAIVSESVRPFGKIEYFSMFGEPDGSELSEED